MIRRAAWGAALGLVMAVGTAWSFEYRVRSGDTLSELAQRFGVSVADIRAANGLRSSTIVVGDVLEIPGGGGDQAEGGEHVVRDGESLWMIALKYRVTSVDLKRANGLGGDVIHPGQRLRIPGGGSVAVRVADDASRPTRVASVPASTPTPGVSQAELEVLARIVKGEMPHDGPFEGKVAVAAVVLNRLRHPSFPKSITSVAHQPLQFSCYNRDVRERLYRGRIPQDAWAAAREAVAGRDPSRGATHYFNPHLVRPAWARQMRFLVRIGEREHDTHDFYRM